jgi:hypothetical protein
MTQTTAQTAEFAIVESATRRGMAYELRDRWGKRLGTILAPCMKLVFGRSAPTFLLKRTHDPSRTPPGHQPVR